MAVFAIENHQSYNSLDSVGHVQFLFSVPKATETYQRLVEQGFPHLIKFLKGVGGFDSELAALEVIRSKANSIIERLLQPIEPMGLITHTDFWCNNLIFKEINKTSETDMAEHKIIECSILDWQMISYSRFVQNEHTTGQTPGGNPLNPFGIVSFQGPRMIWLC